jgi:5-methylcytosine-specific restriction endonuclease McrA
MREYQRRLRAADPRTCLCGKAIEVGSKRRFCTPCGNERRKKSHQESKKKRLEEGRALGKHCACGTWLPAGPRKLCEDCRVTRLKAHSVNKSHRRLLIRTASGCHVCGGQVEKGRRLCSVCRWDRARERGRVQELRRRDRMLATADGSADYVKVLADANSQCQNCGISVTKRTGHVDHIIPLAKGGPHTQGNLQLLCAACNTIKGDR